MAVRWMTITMAVFLVSVALIQGGKTKTKINNGKVEETVKETVTEMVICNAGFTYSGKYWEYKEGEKCLQTQWTGEEANAYPSPANKERLFNLPRAPRAGWALCINLTRTGDERLSVNLVDKTRLHLIYRLAARHDEEEFAIHTAVRNSLQERWDWIRSPTKHTISPFPAQLNQSFSLRIEATEERSMKFSIKDFEAVYPLHWGVGEIDAVEITGDVTISDINVWCA